MQSHSPADWRTNLIRRIGGDDLARRLGGRVSERVETPQRATDIRALPASPRGSTR